MDCSLSGSSAHGIFQARVRWVQLCGSLNILWHCLSLGLEWKLTFSSPVATTEFSKFAGMLRAAQCILRLWFVIQRNGIYRCCLGKNSLTTLRSDSKLEDKLILEFKSPTSVLVSCCARLWVPHEDKEESWAALKATRVDTVGEVGREWAWPPGRSLAASPFPLSGHAQSSCWVLTTQGSKQTQPPPKTLWHHLSHQFSRPQGNWVPTYAETSWGSESLWGLRRGTTVQEFHFGKMNFSVKCFTFGSHRWRVHTEGADTNWCVLLPEDMFMEVSSPPHTMINWNYRKK